MCLSCMSMWVDSICSKTRTDNGCKVWRDVPATKVNAQLLGKCLAERCLACAWRAVQQHYPVPADQLIIHLLVSKQQRAGGILQQARLDLCVIHQAFPKAVELTGGQLPFPAAKV